MTDEKIRIALCDDEPVHTNHVSCIIRRWAEAASLRITLTTYSSAEQFLFEQAKLPSLDILLLDIQMGGMDGIELAKKLRGEGSALQIIFVTGYADFMAEGYDVSALHYLMKPVKEDKLCEVLEKAQQQLRQPTQSLFLTVDGETCRIPYIDILYAEAQGHYIQCQTITRIYKAKMNLSDLQKILGDGFFRCQRSFIVNLRHVRKITPNALTLEGGVQVPLSRGLYEAANRAVIQYFT